MVPYPKVVGDCTSTRLPRSPPLFLIRVPYVASCGSLMLPRSGQGGESVDSFGACTPPHRQPLCGVVGPFSLPVRNRILSCFNFEPKAKFLFCVCFNYFIIFLFCRQIYLVGELHGPRGQVTAPYATVVIFAATTHR